MVVFGLCLLLSIKLSHSTDEIEKQQTTITEAVGDVDSNWTLYKEPYLRRSKRTPVPWEDAGMPSAGMEVLKGYDEEEEKKKRLFWGIMILTTCGFVF